MEPALGETIVQILSLGERTIPMKSMGLQSRRGKRS